MSAPRLAAALLAVLSLGALSLSAAPAAGSDPTDPLRDPGGWDREGVVPLGTGHVLAPGVDHHRFRIPDGVVGLRVDEPVPLRVLRGCGPGAVCVDNEAVVPPCLAVLAPAGAAMFPYAFAWAYSEDLADVLLSEVPVGAVPSTLPQAAGVGLCG